MNARQLTLIKKDIHSITSNKQVLLVMLVVPLVLTIVVPSMFVLLTLFAPDAISDFEKLLAILPIPAQEYDPKQMILTLMINKIMPAFFLIIPIMASSVMAASSFVGEKEKHTLETLLYSPLSLKQLFQSKILAGFFVGMMTSFLSFAAMFLVLETELLLLTGAAVTPDLNWLLIMLLVSPSIAIVAIAITVRGSAKAQTMEEAQQSAVFLVFPVIALIIGQFTGVILLNPLLLFGFGIVLALLAVFLMKSIAGKFTYEALLK